MEGAAAISLVDDCYAAGWRSGVWDRSAGLAWIWARVVSPRKGGPVKDATYECGLESKGDAWIQFHSSYYIYAIVFLIFDVETVFLLPFAVAFTGLSAGACLAMLIFVLLLLEGLVWACGKGVLKWA